MQNVIQIHDLKNFNNFFSVLFRRHYKHVNPNGTRKNPESMDFSKKDFQYPATVPLDMESHGGEDVAVFAVGPWSHLFTGFIFCALQ